MSKYTLIGPSENEEKKGKKPSSLNTWMLMHIQLKSFLFWSEKELKSKPHDIHIFIYLYHEVWISLALITKATWLNLLKYCKYVKDFSPFSIKTIFECLNYGFKKYNLRTFVLWTTDPALCFWQVTVANK